jgi:hypothetical protein
LIALVLLTATIVLGVLGPLRISTRTGRVSRCVGAGDHLGCCATVAVAVLVRSQNVPLWSRRAPVLKRP